MCARRSTYIDINNEVILHRKYESCGDSLNLELVHTWKWNSEFPDEKSLATST